MSKLLLYCTKSKPYLYRNDDDTFKLENKIVDEDISDYKKYYGLNNGTIVAECDFEVEKIEWESFPGIDGNSFDMYATWKCNQAYILHHSCLTFEQLDNYLGEYKEGYAIHIKNLHIFDEPRKLNEYYRYCNCSYNPLKPIEVAPQNMQKAYNFKEFDETPEYILISIRPEWLCKILNGEKTIEVRKKVLKGMINNE